MTTLNIPTQPLTEQPILSAKAAVSPQSNSNTYFFSNKLFGFDNPITPVVIIPDEEENMQTIGVTTEENNIYYFQRKGPSNKSLTSSVFYKSLSDLLDDAKTPIEIYSEDEEVNTVDVPNYSNIDNAQVVFKLIFLLQYNLSNPQSNEEIKKLILQMKNIAIMTNLEFQDFVSEFHTDTIIESELLKREMIGIKDKKEEMEIDLKLNSIIHTPEQIRKFRLFFIEFISYLRINSLLILALLKNHQEMEESVIKAMLERVSRMKIKIKDNIIELKDLKFTDIIPTIDKINNEKEEASSYKIKTLVEFQLILGYVFYNIFGSSEFSFENENSNSKIFNNIVNNIRNRNPLFVNIFKESQFEDRVSTESLSVLLTNFTGDNINNTMNLIYKVITFYQLYSTLSWFYIIPDSIYNVVGFDTIYDKPLYDQYLLSNFIGEKLEESGQISIRNLLPISSWSLFWSKESIEKHIRIYNLQNWAFSVIAINYDSENFYPFMLASDKRNFEEINKGIIPKEFMQELDDYEYHFINRNAINSFITESVYGTFQKGSILYTGAIIEQFLNSIGWQAKNSNSNNKKSNSNKVNYDSNLFINTIIRQIITLINKLNNLNDFFREIAIVHTYLLSEFLNEPISKDELIQLIQNTKTELLEQNFKNTKKLIDFVQQKLKEKKLNYYIYYYFLNKNKKLNKLLQNKSYNQKISPIPVASIKSQMFNFKLMNASIILPDDKVQDGTKNLDVHPIFLRKSVDSDEVIDTEFYITENGYIVRGVKIKEGKIVLEQVNIRNIEFMLVRKINDKNLEKNKKYPVQIYNSEFHVIKVNPASNEIITLAIIKVIYNMEDLKKPKEEEEEKKNNEENKTNYVFTPSINSEKNIEEHEENILKNIEKGNDAYIDIKLGDNILFPLDLTFIILLSRYLMTSTGAGIAFSKNKFDLDLMYKYEDVFHPDGSTRYDAKVVKDLTRNGIRASFSPLTIVNPNQNFTQFVI